MQPKKGDSHRSRKASGGRSGSKRVKPAIDVPRYPNARPLPAPQGPHNVEIVEMASDDAWNDVLAYYEKLLPEQGWQLFNADRFQDRGTLSYRRTERETLTVLAVREPDATHIRIYIQIK